MFVSMSILMLKVSFQQVLEVYFWLGIVATVMLFVFMPESPKYYFIKDGV